MSNSLLTVFGLQAIFEIWISPKGRCYIHLQIEAFASKVFLRCKAT